MQTLTLYRKSQLGETLKSTIEEFKDSNKINETLSTKINLIFDKVKLLSNYTKILCEEISKNEINKGNKCSIKVRKLS